MSQMSTTPPYKTTDRPKTQNKIIMSLTGTEVPSFSADLTLNFFTKFIYNY